MGYKIYKMRPQGDDVTLLDLDGVSATITIVTNVNLSASTVTTSRLIVSNGIITSVTTP